MNRAFSLIELLVTIVILSILALLGLRFYNEQKKSIYVTWTQAEMTDVLRIAKVAKGADGFYHQYIYAMGYRPKGKVYAVVGTQASRTVICCSKYPDPGIVPCSKAWRSGFLYYNCSSRGLDTATNNITICNHDAYRYSCDTEGRSLSFHNVNFSSCPPDPSTWCDCNRFVVGAVTFFEKEMSLNSQGVLCQGN